MRRLLAIVGCCAALSVIAAEPASAAFGFLGEWNIHGAALEVSPTGVAVDANGVYVADTNRRIQRFTATGGFVSAWRLRDGRPAEFPGQPQISRGIVTGSGSVYVADTFNHRIQRFTPSGAFLGAFGVLGRIRDGDFENPQGLATDAAGNVYVTDTTSRIQVFTPTGGYLRQFGTRGSGDGQLSAQTTVAVDPAGNAYVADFQYHRVQKFDSAGAFVAKWGSEGRASGQFRFPNGIAIGPGGVVHVADSGNNRIQTFTTAGRFVSSFGSLGPPPDTPCPGQFRSGAVDGLATNAGGDLYVLDQFYDRVQRFGDGGVALGCSPVLGKAVRVRVVSGKVFVALPAGSAGASGTVPGLKGKRFVPVTGTRQIPVGSLLDTRKGKVRLTSARDTKGTTQTGDFTAGVFQVLQSRKKAAKGLTELRLKGASFNRCGRPAKRSQAVASRLSRRAIRRLRANAKGRFRTRGRYSAATVRGTTWTTTDRCDGTLTKVTRGKVAVRDFRRRTTILLRSGKSYLAKAKR